MVEYVVDGTQQACLQAAFDFMAGDGWPFRGEVRRHSNAVVFQGLPGETRGLTGSVGGWLVLLLLSLVTAGAFLAGYLLYVLAFKDREAGRAQVFAAAAGPGKTRVSVSANKPNLERVLGGWAKESLLFDRAALRATATGNAPTNNGPAPPTGEGNRPG